MIVAPGFVSAMPIDGMPAFIAAFAGQRKQAVSSPS